MLSSKTNALLTHTLASFWRKQSCCKYPYFTKALDAKDRPRQTTPAATIASVNLRITFYYYIVSYFYKLANHRGHLY